MHGLLVISGSEVDEEDFTGGLRVRRDLVRVLYLGADVAGGPAENEGAAEASKSSSRSESSRNYPGRCGVRRGSVGVKFFGPEAIFSFLGAMISN